MSLKPFNPEDFKLIQEWRDDMKSFIGAGGAAQWEYLVFKHNQHQVDDAKKLAIELGFKGFYAKEPLGFTTAPFLVGDEVFIEGIKKYSTDGSGFNSEDYGFKFFKVSLVSLLSFLNLSKKIFFDQVVLKDKQDETKLSNIFLNC